MKFPVGGDCVDQNIELIRLFSFLLSIVKNTNTTQVEIKSDTGAAIQIPVIPHHSENNANKGRRIISCLRRVRKRDIFALPML